MPKNMLLDCGQPVYGIVISCALLDGLYLHQNRNIKNLFTTTKLYSKLSNFCTQLVNTQIVNFTPVNQMLCSLSTAPTITITTYI